MCSSDLYSDNGENRYQINVYDTENLSSAVKIHYFDMEYTDLFFEKGNLVIYNETECQVITLDGREKFHGSFAKPVRLMLPAGNGYRYLLITDDSMDTIQLK